jgi:putative sterol carrier protein
MSDTTQAFFERLAKRGYEPLLHRVSGNIRCDIEGAESWYVVVKKGSMTVSRDTAGADCVIACSQEDFDRMVVGKQNPTTLYMQGKLKITGDRVLSQMVQRLFPDESLSDVNQA